MDSFVRELLTEWRRLELPTENAVFVAAIEARDGKIANVWAIANPDKLRAL